MADNETTCTASGPAKLSGLEHGGTTAADNYCDNRQRCIDDRLLGFIRVLEETRDIYHDTYFSVIEIKNVED